MVSQPQQPKKAVIYCRVSTKEQVEEGSSLVTQERYCKEYALKHGYEVVSTFIEEGESAKTAKRTQLQKLIAFCSLKRNKISIVIAYKIDRISRNTDDYSQIRIVLRRYGIEIKSTSEHFEDNPAGRFMENIIANVAQFDNDVRAERSIAGMKEAVREGRYVWQAPYGYTNVRVNGKATIALTDNAHFVKQAFELVASQHMPSNEIRNILTANGMVSASKKSFSKSFFYSMLRNELYAGWINKFGEKKRGVFETVIEDGLFQAVQVALDGKKFLHTNHTTDNPDFPLRKFFHHTNGKVLTGAWSTGRNKKYPYYFFHHPHFSIKKDLLETTFQDWLNTYFTMDVSCFEQLKNTTIKKSNEGLEKAKATTKNIQTQITKLKEKQQLLVDKNLSGVISDVLVKESINIIDTQIFSLKQQLNSLSAYNINESEILERVRNVLLRPGDVWAKADVMVKRKLQWFYFPDGITLTENESRTHKICKLFKGNFQKVMFQSSNVTHRNRKSNTLNWQNLVFDTKGEIQNNILELKEEIKSELLALNNIIKPPLSLKEQYLLGAE